MKLIFLFLVFFLAQATIKAQTIKTQPLPEWFRIYTYEDSIIELNTNYVMFSSQKAERIRFRWIFQQLQTLDEKSQIKYQTILQEVRLDCRNKDFRLYSAQWLDGKGHVVANEIYKEDENRRKIRFGSMMEKFYESACKLIELRKRQPPVES